MRGKVKKTQNTNTTSSSSNHLTKPLSFTNLDPQNVFHSPPFIHPEFTHRRHWHIITTTVFSLSTDWIYASVDGGDEPPQLLHPLTLKPHHYSSPPLNLKLCASLTSFKHTDYPFDKLVIPPSRATTLDRNTMIVLFAGGQLVARLPFLATNKRVKWVSLSKDKFDDIIISKGSAFGVDTSGELYDIVNYITGQVLRMRPYHMTLPVTPGLTHVGFRKRLVSDSDELYLVVRLEVKVFKVFKKCEYCPSYWDEVNRFDGGKVLFVSKDCCFLTYGFGGWDCEYENCIVFSEAGFPRYGDDEWAYNGDDELGVYSLCDGSYGKVGESDDFPEIDWSPPSWVFHDSEADEDGELQEGMEEQDERHDSNIRDLEGGKMQCDSNSREKEDEEMQSKANIEGDISLQQDVPASLFASISAVEEEVTRTLLLMNGGNEPTDKETSRENYTISAPRACTTSSTSTKRYKSDYATTKFEGFDIRSDLVPTLQKIWRNQGNIIENCPIHSSALISNALESLASVVQILENNSAESLNESQADYLSTTLSDLRFMCFNVDWLSSFVEKAVKLHKSKALVDSLNKLEQLSSQVKESRAIFLEKAAKLTEEEKKLEKEMVRVSKLIPLSGEVKFDEPFGSGLS